MHLFQFYSSIEYVLTLEKWKNSIIHMFFAAFFLLILWHHLMKSDFHAYRVFRRVFLLLNENGISKNSFVDTFSRLSKPFRIRFSCYHVFICVHALCFALMRENNGIFFHLKFDIVWLSFFICTTDWEWMKLTVHR